MAKQSGIHQLKGKVGEMSYYRQSGVIGGLVRSINQGMSSRVKTSDEYANTRLNNAEFGAACNVAGILGDMVVPKFRPMILPFSQSNMAKKVLELAKQNSGAWGQRVVGTADTVSLAEILSAQSKLSFDEIASLSIDDSSGSDQIVELSINVDQATLLSSLGVSGVYVSFRVYNVLTGKYSSQFQKIAKSTLSLAASSLDEEAVTAGTAITVERTFNVGEYNPAPTLFNEHIFLVAIIMPFRTIGGNDYTLQEYCRFKAFQMTPIQP